LLVDRRGEVRYSVEGAPTPLDQAEMIRLTRSLDVLR